MVRVLIGALRRRGSQAVLLAVLAALASASAAAAPRYLAAAAGQVARSDVRAAQAWERILTVSGDARPTEVDTAVAELRGLLGRHLSGVGTTTVTEVELPGLVVGFDRVAARPAFEYRQDACAKSKIIGVCPNAHGEALIGTATAAAFGWKIGDTFAYQSIGAASETQMKVVGIYSPLNSAEPYWAKSGLVGVTATTVDAPVFVTSETVTGSRPRQLTVRLSVLFDDDLFAQMDPDRFKSAVASEVDELSRAGYTCTESVAAMAQRVRADQRLLAVGVPVLTTQLLVVCWIALFLAIGYTGNERRTDLALCRLRGLGGVRTWILIGGQSAVPVIAGGLLAAAPGYLLGRALSGPLPAHGFDWSTVGRSAAYSGAAVLGALAAGFAAQWRTARTPVVELVRRIPGRGRQWQARVVDLVVVIVAIAGIYQARQVGAEGRGMILLIPGLLALAVGVGVIRTSAYLATQCGVVALRHGQPAALLAAGFFARGRQTLQVGVLLTFASAMVVSAGLGWTSTGAAYAQRASAEVGAAAVYQVRAASPAQLLAGVRKADPGGRSAMAALLTAAKPGAVGTQKLPAVLAVDSSRLAAVGSWHREYGAVGQLVERLRSGSSNPVEVTGAAISVELTVGGTPAGRYRLGVELSTAAGEVISVGSGVLVTGRQAVTMATPGCAAEPCRLIGLSVLPPEPGGAGSATASATASASASKGLPGGMAGDLPRDLVGDLLGGSAEQDGQIAPDGLPGPAVQIVLHTMSAGSRLAVTRDRFRDRPAWRTPADASKSQGFAAATSPVGLLLHVPIRQAAEQGGDPLRILVADSASELPVVVAGAVPESIELGQNEVPVIGSGTAVIRMAGTVEALPRLGNSGLLVDLEQAVRTASTAGTCDSAQVWLSDGADVPAVLDRLRSAGIEVLDGERIADRLAHFESQGAAYAVRFQLFAAIFGLLLAMGTMAVAMAVESPARAADLAAMRVQGMSERTVATVCRFGAPLTVAVFALAGAATGVAASVGFRRFPAFVDLWVVFPPPQPASPLAVVVLLLGVLVSLGSVAILGSVGLFRSVRLLGAAGPAAVSAANPAPNPAADPAANPVRRSQ